MKKDTLIQKLILLCGESINLADEYAGGESETVDFLTKELERLEKIAGEQEQW